MGDVVNFSNAGTTGFADGRVSLLKGRGVSSIVSNEVPVSNVSFLPSKEKGFYKVESSSPHSLENLDVVTISGMSTTSSGIEGSYTIGVTVNHLE